MFSDKTDSKDEIIHIKNENDLPEGRLVSFTGDDLDVGEKSRKEMMVWEILNTKAKMVWIITLKNSYNSLHAMQAIKTAEKKGYTIAKKCTIESSILNNIYDKRGNAETQKATGDDSVVILAFQVILADALSENISDIHIEVRPNGGNIRMRKNGEMMTYKADQRLSFTEANNLCSVMYNVLATTKSVSFDPRECQQAAVNYSIKDQELKLRYQSVPAYPDGYDVILRVLPIGRSEDFVPLQKLGYTEQQVSELLNISSRPVGSLIIAGVTGSGKSTTLKNLLMYINANSGYKIKIYSIEDPPEYNIAKITQIPVVIGKDFDPTKVSPFEKPIKACMRGDPDIIMIGEVRDKITGDLTKKAVQSGHQVLTTVHATSALGIIDRFEDFGLSRNVMGSPDFLTGLLYQKLLPVVCPECAIDFNKYIEGENATAKDIGLYKRLMTVTDITKYPVKKRNEAGCPHCNYTGIKGRSVAAEVIMIDMQMMELIAKGLVIDLMSYWRSLSDRNPASENMRGKTCMEHGFQKVLAGLVCPDDLEISFRPIDEMLMKRTAKDEQDFTEELDKNKWANL